jgi:hypothetical protein
MGEHVDGEDSAFVDEARPAAHEDEVAGREAGPAFRIRVGIAASRIILPIRLPERASPPGERTQISSILVGSYWASAAWRRSGAPSSISPSALRMRWPPLSSSVKRIWR